MIMKWKDLKTIECAELERLLKKSREDLRAVRFRIKSGEERNVRRERDLRQTIARILTLLDAKTAVK
jgi:ribosomal protein L29